MVKSQITNLNHPTREHGVRMCVGLDYDTPPAMAKEVLLTAANNAQGVLASPPPVVFLKEFADSSIIYELRFWMEFARLYNITCDEIRTNLWYELGRQNIRIPYPIRSIEKRQPNLPASLVSAKAKAAEILRSDAALSCLTESEASDLLRRGSFLLFGPKEDLVKLGQPGESMYLILEGRVEVLGKCVDSSPILLAQLNPGECFGELSLMTGEPRAATVRAISDVLVLEIRKADLSPLIAQNPELAERLGSLLEQRRKAGAETLHHAQSHAHLTTKSSPETRSLATRIRNFFASSPQP
jgi:CRP-like cAMP-binding protein